MALISPLVFFKGVTLASDEGVRGVALGALGDDADCMNVRGQRALCSSFDTSSRFHRKRKMAFDPRHVVES